MLPYHVVDKYGDRRIDRQRSEGDESGWIGINSRALQSWRAFRTGIYPPIFRTKHFLVSTYFSVSLLLRARINQGSRKIGFTLTIACIHSTGRLTIRKENGYKKFWDFSIPRTMRGSFHSVQRILKMLSATRSTVFFFFSMSAAMLCDSRDCYAQAAGDATVVYGDRVGNVVTANCDYWSNSGNYRA